MTPIPAPFPYTTLFRSDEAMREVARITDVKQSSAGYQNYQQWISNTQLEQRVSLEDYSVSNRGLRSEEQTSELQSPCNLVCRLLLEKKKDKQQKILLHQ